MRQREQHDLSEEARRELDALDRALAGEPVDAEFDGVARLARDLRAERPAIPADFATRLDARVEDGFRPEPGSSSGAGSRFREWIAGIRAMRVIAPAGAVATVVVVASVAVIQSGGGETGAPLDGTEQTATATAPAPTDEVRGEADAAPAIPEDAGALGEASGGVAEQFSEDSAVQDTLGAGGDSEAVAPGERGRKVEQSAALSLSADGDEFETVTDGVVEVTDQYGGFVLASEASSSGERSRAVFDLEIPSGRLSAALADLSALAHVEARSEDTEDITAQTVTARQRLADARAQVKGLLGQLAAADTPKQTDRIQARLDIARSEAAVAKAEAQRLARRADFSDVRVTVTSDGGGDGDWGIEEAIDDIGDALSTAGGVALVSAAIVLPIGIVIALIGLAWRQSVRRGRERALGD